MALLDIVENSIPTAQGNICFVRIGLVQLRVIILDKEIPNVNDFYLKLESNDGTLLRRLQISSKIGAHLELCRKRQL